MSSCTLSLLSFRFFFFNDTATTEIYTLSLHDALPICGRRRPDPLRPGRRGPADRCAAGGELVGLGLRDHRRRDRKSTRLNSSHANISYAVFCLKKKKTEKNTHKRTTHNSNTLHYIVHV